MNKAVIWIIAAILGAALLASLAMVALEPKPTAMQSNQPAPTVSAPQNETTNTTPGVYTTYSTETFADTSGRRVLFFHAGWCPQCRELDKSITDTGVPEGMTIFKVDYDTQTDLRQKYGITLQTTVVEVDAEGTLLKKHVAYSEPSLPAVLKALE